jgi:archaetidylinositol phosphate synthase
MTHERINTGVLAAAEKRTLVWMANRLPRWVNSDHLTLLALVAMAGTGGAFWLARAWPPALALVVFALAVNWFGDSLDGTLARVRRHERPRYGFYVDHVVDIAGASLLFGGMALSGFMSPVVALALLAAYLLVAAEVFLATAINGTFRMSFLNVGPTELRILLSLGALALFTHPVVTPFGLGPFRLFDIGGSVAIVGLAVAFITSASRTTRALYRAEPLPASPALAPVIPHGHRVGPPAEAGL